MFARSSKHTADFLDRQGSQANLPAAFFFFGTRPANDAGALDGAARSCSTEYGFGSSFLCSMMADDASFLCM